MTLLLISLVTTIVGAGAVTAALRLPRASVTFTAFWVLLVTQVVLEGLLMGGLLRLFRPWSLTAAALTVAIVEVLLVRRQAPSAIRTMLVQIGSALQRPVSRLLAHPVVLLLASLVLAQYLWQLAEIFRLPQVSYDSLSYHLIGPATWIQHGAIVHSRQEIFSDTFPADQELLSGWIGVYLGTLRFVGLCTLPFVALGASAVIMISRSLGARRSLAVVAGLGFVALPVVFLQASTAYVDIAAGSTVIAGFGFAVMSRAFAKMEGDGVTGLVSVLLVAGCAAGLAAGTQSVNLLAAFLIVVVALIQSGRVWRRIRAADLAKSLGVLVVPIFGLAAFWYLRTWFTYSNPFYPISLLGFGGWGPVSQIVIGANEPTILHNLPLGPLGQMAVSWAFDLHRHSYSYDQRPGGLGPQWLVFGVPALLAAAISFARKKREYLFGLVLPVLVVVFATGAAWYARYDIGLAGVGLVCFAYCLEQLRRRHFGWRIAKLAPALLADMFVALTALGMWWATTPTYFQLANANQTYATASQLESVITASDPADNLEPWAQFAPLDRLIPKGDTIVYVGNDEPEYTYPLVGQDLQHVLVRLGAFNSAQLLAGRMFDDHFRFVVLGHVSTDSTLFLRVGRDYSQFRKLIGGGDLNGQDLFELVASAACSNPYFVLTGEETTPIAQLHVTANLSNECGPESHVPITLVQGVQGYPLTPRREKVIATKDTSGRGNVSFTILNPPRNAQYALVQAGRARYPAATKPFTPEYIPITRSPWN